MKHTQGFVELRRRTEGDGSKETFVVVGQDRRRCTRFCYSVEDMNQMDVEKVLVRGAVRVRRKEGQVSM
jgi:hypothetical protein